MSAPNRAPKRIEIEYDAPDSGLIKVAWNRVENDDPDKGASYTHTWTTADADGEGTHEHVVGTADGGKPILDGADDLLWQVALALTGASGPAR